MSDLLAGYDMLVSITENETNSQFERLFKSQVIDNKIAENSVGIGNSDDPFEGGSKTLRSWIRGHITAPKVRYATKEDPKQVPFYFSFARTAVTADDLGVQPNDLEKAFAQNPNDADGLLIKPEDIAYKDEQGREKVLKGQPVYLWLQRKEFKIGTLSKYHYFQVPAIFYELENNKIGINLDGLQISFEVRLSHRKTTTDGIQKDVKKGDMSSHILQVIRDKGFSAELFDINHLFLNFDTTDFTQWELKKPADKLGEEIDIMLVKSDAEYKLHQEPLGKITGVLPDFRSKLSTSLQDAFGVSSTHKNPYIIGVSCSSTNPQASNPNTHSSLVPTYIRYGTTPNTAGPGLATIDYQILGGSNPTSRIPKHQDGSVVDITTNFVNNNSYSGELVFAENIFTEPFVVQSLQNAMNSGTAWSGSSGNYTTHCDGGRQMMYQEKTTALGIGYVSNVYEQVVKDYRINLKGNKIFTSGTIKQTVTIEVIAENWIHDVNFSWWKTGTIEWSNDITMHINSQQQLAFSEAPNFPRPAVGSTHENLGGDLVSFVSEIYKKLSFGYFDPLGKSMRSVGDIISVSLSQATNGLNQHLASGMHHNFISPTGQVFALNNPRFNADYDLQMDITYDV